MPSQAHLLTIPQEIRDHVYAEIVKQIQAQRRTFEGNPTSDYDGLRLTCRQLYQETLESVFFFAFTSHQIPRIFDFKTNKTSFESVRSISIEIPSNSKPEQFHNIKNFLNCMQLSLQELRIFFIGNDRQGNPTGIFGCGKKRLFTTGCDRPLLLDQGQDFGYQWELIRQIAVLRNLRVMQIENANLPLTAGILYNNKPFLKALSITSDPRSVSSSLTRMKRSQVLHLHRNIGVKVAVFPPLKVLSLTANAITNVEGAVMGVSRNLRHFSWRVPNPDFQVHHQEQSFYSITNRLMHALCWRAPMLETLRLCIAMRERQPGNETQHREQSIVTEELSHRLHRFPALKHLEIHYRGSGDFFRGHLIERVPPSLSRLYLSDHTISAAELVAQVRRRYFTYPEDDNDDENGMARNQIAATPTRTQELPHNTLYEPLPAEENVRPDYLSEHVQLRSQISCGEQRDRHDDIPLSGGKLGFVDFEYSIRSPDSTLAFDADSSATSAQIMRLNGQLLDREHNLHLGYTQLPGAPYGVEPCQEEQAVWQATLQVNETSKSSCHVKIYNAIYNSDEMAPKVQAVKKNEQDLTACFLRTKSKWDWYFGNEEEAMKIFEREPVARTTDQKQKSTMVEIEVSDDARCRWSSPDFEVPPVGSFPVPKVPFDWRDHV